MKNVTSRSEKIKPIYHLFFLCFFKKAYEAFGSLTSKFGICPRTTHT